jgi:hypothetical protein
MATGGYSRIALNNLNATTSRENIDQVDALTYGVALGTTIKKFQIALVLGSDRYNINDAKEHKNWLSIAFGFSILKDPQK